MNLIEKFQVSTNRKPISKEKKEISVNEAIEVLDSLKGKKFTGIDGYRGMGNMQQKDFPKSVDQIAGDFAISMEGQVDFILSQLGGEEEVTKECNIKNPEAYSTVFYDKTEYHGKIEHEMESHLGIRNKDNTKERLIVRDMKYKFITEK